MKKRNIVLFITFLLSVLCLGGLSSCGKDEKQGSDDGTHIYYVNEDRSGLMEEEYTPDESDPVGQLISDIQKDPENTKFQSAFVDGAEIESYRLEDTDLEIYFNSKYKKLNHTDRALVKAVVVKSLVSLSQVDYVKFYVGDRPLKDKGGNELGYMNADSFVEGVGSTLHTMNEDVVQLYCPDESGIHLVVKEEKLIYGKDVLKEKAIVESIMPANTKLLNVTEENNICYLNFDEGFLEGTAGVAPKVHVYAIVDSIIENTSISQVQILVNGKIVENYLDVVDLSKPLTHDFELLKEE